jgi:hypothetical protein
LEALQLYLPWSDLLTCVIVNTDLKGLFAIITLLSDDKICESFLQVIAGSGVPSTSHCNLTRSPAIAVLFKTMLLNFGGLFQVVGVSNKLLKNKVKTIAPYSKLYQLRENLQFFHYTSYHTSTIVASFNKLRKQLI